MSVIETVRLVALPGVCAPELLDGDCKTIDHMRLANALCRDMLGVY